MKLRRRLCLLWAVLPTLAISQAYPNKPVRLMVGANAGGGTDIVARMLADKMSESMRGVFVVENRPGASNTIAADMTAKAPADGHTLLVATNTGQAISPHLMKLNFDPIRDLVLQYTMLVKLSLPLLFGAMMPLKQPLL